MFTFLDASKVYDLILTLAMSHQSLKFEKKIYFLISNIPTSL